MPNSTPSSLTFRELLSKSSSRAKRWHDKTQPWSPSDWAVATAGEHGEFIGEFVAFLELITNIMRSTQSVGEALNALKKLRRVETGLANINEEGRQLYDIISAKQKIGKEVADWFIYTPCLMESLGINLEDQIIEVFNQKSDEYGFPELLSKTGADMQLANRIISLAHSLGMTHTNHKSVLQILEELEHHASKLRRT